MQTLDLSKLSLYSKDQRSCKRELAEIRWNGKFDCPACGGSKYYFLKKRMLYECANRDCRKQTSSTSGTQLHGTKRVVELFYVIKNQRDGSDTSLKAIRKLTRSSHKTAKRMQSKIAGTHFQSQLNEEKAERVVKRRNVPLIKHISLLTTGPFNKPDHSSKARDLRCADCMCPDRLTLSDSRSVRLSLNSFDGNPMLHIAYAR